jgi:DNA-binding transcriptional ArsR family regulator
MRDEDVEEFIAALKELTDLPVLIVIDTLARCMNDGDENMARDMGKLIAGCDRIRRETGAAVLLIHHGTRSHEFERGSSALRGAVDTALAVSRSDKQVTLSCAKQKDEARFEDMVFDLRVVDLGKDEDGYPVSSCVLSPTGSGTSEGQSHDGLGLAQSQMCRVLRDSSFEEGLSSDAWQEACGVPRSTFYRHRQPLVDEGYVELFEKDGQDRFRLGRRYLDEFGPTVPPSPTQSHASSGTSPTPPPPLKGEAGRTGTGTETGNDSSSPRRKGQGR